MRCGTARCGSRSGRWVSRGWRFWWSGEGPLHELFLNVARVFGAILEFGLGVDVDEVDGADGAVALFGDDQLGETAEVFAIALVDFFAEDKADDVCVLLDGVVDDDVAGNEVVEAGDGEVEDFFDAV